MNHLRGLGSGGKWLVGIATAAVAVALVPAAGAACVVLVGSQFEEHAGGMPAIAMPLLVMSMTHWPRGEPQSLFCEQYL